MKPPTTSVDVTLGMTGTSTRPARVPHVERRLDPAEQRLMAFRLRREGMSYRRIASRMRVSYSTVACWLDGPEPAAASHPRHRPYRPPSAPPLRRSGDREEPRKIQELVAQNRRLGQKIEHLTQKLTTLERKISALESRLRQEMKQLFDSLSEKILALAQSAKE